MMNNNIMVFYFFKKMVWKRNAKTKCKRIVFISAGIRIEYSCMDNICYVQLAFKGRGYEYKRSIGRCFLVNEISLLLFFLWLHCTRRQKDHCSCGWLLIGKNMLHLPLPLYLYHLFVSIFKMKIKKKLKLILCFTPISFQFILFGFHLDRIGIGRQPNQKVFGI